MLTIAPQLSVWRLQSGGVSEIVRPSFCSAD